MNWSSTMLQVFTIIAVVFALVWGVRWLVPKMVYPAPMVSVGDPPVDFSEIRIRVPEAGEVVGWLHEKAGAPDSLPVMLYLSGNAENLETLRMSQQLAAFQQLEIHLLAINYPGYGNSEGSPSEAALVSAATRAMEFLAEKFPDNPKIIAGWSLGAGVAIQAAVNYEKTAGLMLFSPWSSLPEVAAEHYPRWLVGLVMAEKYNSMTAALEVKCPTLVVHGELDNIIPVAHSERVVGNLKVLTRYTRIFDAGHNDIFGRSELWEQIVAFLRDFQKPNFGDTPPEENAENFR